jgi:hypothetical protein
MFDRGKTHPIETTMHLVTQYHCFQALNLSNIPISKFGHWKKVFRLTQHHGFN